MMATGTLAPVSAMPQAVDVASGFDGPPCDMPCKGCPGGTMSAGCAAFCCTLPATVIGAVAVPMACAMPSFAADTLVGHGRSIRPSPHPPRA